MRFESSAQTPGSNLDHVNVTGMLWVEWRSFLTWKEPSRVGICFVSTNKGEWIPYVVFRKTCTVLIFKVQVFRTWKMSAANMERHTE